MKLWNIFCIWGLNDTLFIPWRLKSSFFIKNNHPCLNFQGINCVLERGPYLICIQGIFVFTPSKSVCINWSGEKVCLWNELVIMFWNLYNVCTKYLPVQIFYRCVYLCRTLYIVQKTFIICLNEGSYCWCRHCYMLLRIMFCVCLLCWIWDINKYFTNINHSMISLDHFFTELCALSDFYWRR